MAGKHLFWFRLFGVMLFTAALVVGTTGPVYAKTEVAITPATLSLAANQSSVLEIKIDSTVNLIGSDLVLKYDQATVSIDKIEAGSFWQNPQVLVNRTEETNGKAYFSVFGYPAKAGNGVFARVNITKKGSGGSTISIDNQTIMAGEGGQKIVYTSQDATVSFIDQTVPTTTPTPVLVNTIAPTKVLPSPTVVVPTQTSIQVSASVAASASPTIESEPVIMLEATPTTKPAASKISSGFALQLVALLLLIFGTLAFFTFKKNF